MFTWNVRMINSEVKKAVEIISAGGILLYPTDTIWGIGCDATNARAVQRIYEIKQRSDSKSMLVLVPGVEMLRSYVESIPDKALELIFNTTRPTTIIYPGAIHLAPNLLAEDGSVGIRVTSDDFCRKLIEKAGFPIVSTSANISGSVSPGFFRAIDSRIIDQVDHVVGLRQDESESASSSTIIKIEKEGKLTVLRP
jgi:L-threonylcarbamoyladenylate synthase